MPTATATHKPSGTILATADSADYAEVEGNVYFPAASLLVEAGGASDKKTHLQNSKTTTNCPWKGLASYYDLVLDDGSSVKDIGWFYPEPKSKAAHIKDSVAWYKTKVEVKVEA